MIHLVFLKSPFAIDFLKSEAKLAEKLLFAGVSAENIKKILTDKDLHSELEHKDTKEAVDVIKKRFS